MIALTEYAKIIGRENAYISKAIRETKKLQTALEGHVSYGHNSRGCGRAIYLDEKGVDILDAYYGITDDKEALVPVHTAVKTTTKTPSYKRKYDSVQKKLVESLEVQNNLKAEIIDLKSELTKARDEVTMLRNRNLWQRIVNE